MSRERPSAAELRRADRFLSRRRERLPDRERAERKRTRFWQRRTRREISAEFAETADNIVVDEQRLAEAQAHRSAEGPWRRGLRGIHTQRDRRLLFAVGRRNFTRHQERVREQLQLVANQDARKAWSARTEITDRKEAA